LVIKVTKFTKKERDLFVLIDRPKGVEMILLKILEINSIDKNFLLLILSWIVNCLLVIINTIKKIKFFVKSFFNN